MEETPAVTCDGCGELFTPEDYQTHADICDSPSKRNTEVTVLHISTVPQKQAQPKAAPTERMISYYKIRQDKELQLRERTDEQTVQNYAEALDSGVTLPPIVLFQDPSNDDELLLTEGWHRLAAFNEHMIRRQKHGEKPPWEIPALVYIGTRREAIIYAAGANATHGLQRNNKDKRRSVITILNMPEFKGASNRHIAEICKVSDVFVGEVRKEVQPDDSGARVGKDGVVRQQPIKTKKISKPTPPPPVASEPTPFEPLEFPKLEKPTGSESPEPVKGPEPILAAAQPGAAPSPVTVSDKGASITIWNESLPNEIQVLVNRKLIFFGNANVSSCPDPDVLKKALAEIAAASVDGVAK